MDKQPQDPKILIVDDDVAGGATAAYAARAGMNAYVLMPADTPIVNMIAAIRYANSL